METSTPAFEKLFPLNIDDSGRFVIPADSKLRQACRNGSKFVAVESKDGSFAIRPYEDVVRELQARFKQFLKPGRSLVNELLRERREEAARE